MSEFPFRRLLIPLASSNSGLESYLARLRSTNPSIECHFAQVLPEGTRPKPRNVSGATPECILPLHGDLLDELLSLSAELQSDLLILGEHFTQGRHRSLVRRLAMKAPCSVWMLPADSPPAVSNILVPVDFSDCSADALRTAAAIAASQGMEEVTALHVYFDESVVTYEGHASALLEQEQQHFTQFLSRLNLGPVSVRSIWKENPHVADTIVRTAQEQHNDLIVMGTRGRSESASILLGSETEHVLMDSPVPILAVKHFGPHLGLLEALLDRRFREREEVHFS